MFVGSGNRGDIVPNNFLLRRIDDSNLGLQRASVDYSIFVISLGRKLVGKTKKMLEELWC